MNEAPATPVDEYCASLLAACDDALLAGEQSRILQSSDISPELRRRLERALASVRIMRQAFQRRPAEAGARDPLPWTTLGRFQIRRELGRGAYGVVYLAYDPQLRREVALKVPRPEAMVTPELRERFLREARAAANLEHPNLVPVFEAGEIGPICYLASAYCPGTTLAARLKEQRELMPWRDAAELVATLADAVQHAHNRGILHRDLKPSNILLEPKQVKRRDEETRRQGDKETRRAIEPVPLSRCLPVSLSECRPRITDFGLAKFLADGEQESTRTGTVLGTAAYMAPEQASGHNRLVGPQADVYALGVILYELLTGRPPFQADSMLETLEQVRTHEPVPPRHLRPRLPRDLETLCLKCLEKEPGQRYGSAREVCEEMQRCLGGEPIRARPVSAVNRGLRWCRRKPALAAVSGLAAVGLLCALGLAIGLAVQQSRAALRLQDEVTRAENAEREAVANAAKARADSERAKQSAEESQAVLKFFQDKVLAAARPKDQDGGLGREATIRDAVEAAEPLIAKSFTGRPAVAAAIRHTMGNTYFYLGKPKLAIAQLELAVADRRAHLGRDHSDTLDSVDDLAEAYLESGQFDKAIPLYEETLKLREAAQGLGYERRHVTMSGLALAYREAGRLKEAIPLLEEALRLRQTNLGVDHEGTLRSMNNLGLAYKDAGRTGDALKLFEEALKLSKVKMGPEHPDSLTLMNSLAIAYSNCDRVAEAISMFEETVRLRKSKLGPYHLLTLQSMSSLADAYREGGQIAKAISLQTETLNLCRDKLGPDHPYTINSMGTLGLAYWSAGQHAEAIALYKQQLKLRRTKLGPDHVNTIAGMGLLALAYQDAGRLAEAVSLQAETLRLQKAKLGPDHISTLAAMDNLAEAYFHAGRVPESLALYEEAVVRMKEKLAPGHFCTLDTMRGLARVRMARREYAAAEAMLAEAAIGADMHRADNPLEGAKVRALWGDCLLQQGKHREAEAILRDGLAAREPADAKGWETAWTKSLLGGALLGQKKYAEAEPLLVAGYEGMKESESRIPVPERPKLSEALDHVVQLYDAWRKKDQAELWRKKQPKATIPSQSVTAPATSKRK
jgi:serine/threonine protein kinase/tetratricopeptide (TPR) repeat protein